MIQHYFEQIQTCVDTYAATDFVLNASVHFEIRPGMQGYLSGTVIFVDGSTLYFTEFLDEARGQVEKVMYTYHYQDAGQKLIFRYDNARHRPVLLSLEHKHTPQQVASASAPALAAILVEITRYQEQFAL